MSTLPPPFHTTGGLKPVTLAKKESNGTGMRPNNVVGAARTIRVMHVNSTALAQALDVVTHRIADFYDHVGLTCRRAGHAA